MHSTQGWFEGGVSICPSGVIRRPVLSRHVAFPRLSRPSSSGCSGWSSRKLTRWEVLRQSSSLSVVTSSLPHTWAYVVAKGLVRCSIKGLRGGVGRGGSASWPAAGGNRLPLCGGGGEPARCSFSGCAIPTSYVNLDRVPRQQMRSVQPLLHTPIESTITRKYAYFLVDILVS